MSITIAILTFLPHLSQWWYVDIYLGLYSVLIVFKISWDFRKDYNKSFGKFPKILLLTTTDIYCLSIAEHTSMQIDVFRCVILYPERSNGKLCVCSVTEISLPLSTAIKVSKQTNSITWWVSASLMPYQSTSTSDDTTQCLCRLFLTVFSRLNYYMQCDQLLAW